MPPALCVSLGCGDGIEAEASDDGFRATENGFAGTEGADVEAGVGDDVSLTEALNAFGVERSEGTAAVGRGFSVGLVGLVAIGRV